MKNGLGHIIVKHYYSKCSRFEEEELQTRSDAYLIHIKHILNTDIVFLNKAILVSLMYRTESLNLKGTEFKSFRLINFGKPFLRMHLFIIKEKNNKMPL